jgi:hypothetical protein
VTTTSVEQLDFEEAISRGSGRGRRFAVAALAVILAVGVCIVIAAALTQSSWWYSYKTDQPLDDASRARVEAIRDEVEANGTVPEAMVWLNTALDPTSDATTARNHLLAAQEVLRNTGDPRLSEAAKGLCWPLPRRCGHLRSIRLIST